jgi:hypothetical protein
MDLRAFLFKRVPWAFDKFHPLQPKKVIEGEGEIGNDESGEAIKVTARLKVVTERD